MCMIDRIFRSTFRLISLERKEQKEEGKRKKIRSKVIDDLIIVSKRSVGTERNLKKEGIRNCVQIRKKKHDLCSVLNISNDQLYHKMIAGSEVQPPVARIPSFHLVGRPQSKI